MHADELFKLEDALAASRGRLVRLCAHLSGDAEAAEDLAQETLVEAWRHAHKLHDPTGYIPWVWAIARNVCLRHAQRQQRETTRLAESPAAQAAEWAGDSVDLEVDLERDELAALLDEALALLPAATRTVLVERYIHETPQADVAARLGVSQGVVAVRLHRGKLVLRRLLSERLQNPAAYGLVDATSDGWQATRVWCPVCGQARLQMRFNEVENSVAFRCPRCEPKRDVPSSEYRLANAHFARLIGGLTQPRAVLNRTTTWVHEYYRRALQAGTAPCTNCGRPAPLRPLTVENNPPDIADRRGRYVYCEACGETVLTSFRGLVQALPAVQQFWRDQGRLRTLPEREVEVEGRAALVSRFESVTGQAALDIVSAAETYEVIAVHGAPDAAGR